MLTPEQFEEIRRRNERNFERAHPFDDRPDDAWDAAYDDIDRLLQEIEGLRAEEGGSVGLSEWFKRPPDNNRCAHRYAACACYK